MFTVRTPPLRERRQDIPVLVWHFLSIYGAQANPVVRGISPEAEAILRNYDWPGNVRQLQNVVEHAVAMASSDVLLQDDLPQTLVERARNGFKTKSRPSAKPSTKPNTS